MTKIKPYYLSGIVISITFLVIMIFYTQLMIFKVSELGILDRTINWKEHAIVANVTSSIVFFLAFIVMIAIFYLFGKGYGGSTKFVDFLMFSLHGLLLYAILFVCSYNSFEGLNVQLESDIAASRVNPFIRYFSFLINILFMFWILFSIKKCFDFDIKYSLLTFLSPIVLLVLVKIIVNMRL